MKIFYLLLAASFLTTNTHCVDSAATTSTGNGFAVVELFTSEGCSSCPPADDAVSRLLKKHPENVYVLGYHVDYWNSLGWKDIFSSAAYTQIQRSYVKSLKLKSAYTPQIVVNGTEQFVGSNEKQLNEVVSKNLQQPSAIQLNIAAKADKNKVMVYYTTSAVNATLKVALIQLEAESKIQRGENSGVTLHHVNIVRDIKSIPATANGNINLKLPDNVDKAGCRVIAFTQTINDNKITAATEIKIE